MSGANNNGYAESKRLLLGIGDLYINGVFVGNLKGQVTMKYNRKYAFQRAGNNIADQKGDITEEELTLEGEICDIKLSQLRRAFGITQAVDSSTAKTMTRRQIVTLVGTTSVALAKTATGSVRVFSLDRKTTYVSGVSFKQSGGGIERTSAGSILASGASVIAEYEWSNLSGNSLQFGGESSPPPTFQVDYVHLDTAGKAWQVRLFKAMTTTNFQMAFHEAMKGTFTTYNIVFKALVDTTKIEGQNMGEIIEEAPTA
jgi:hypothetical protein